MKVGKAKYGSGKKTFKIEKDQSNVFRILPPLGLLADAGRWYQYYRVEWGYKNSKDEHRPFLDCRVVNFKNKMVEVESEAYLRREALKKKWEELKALEKSGKMTANDQVALEKVAEARKRYNLDAKYYVNAVNLKNEIGLLKLNSTQYKALRTQIDELMKQGVDPLSVDDGRFFNFSKSNETGKIQDWSFSVHPYQENVEAEVNGKKVVLKQDKVHKMDDSFIARLSIEAFELSGMYPEVTAEEVSRIVREGVPAIDEILGFRDNATNVTSSVSDEEKETLTEGVTPESKVETTPPTVTETAPVVEEAKKTETPTVVEEAKKEVAASEETSSASADDEFLKSIGALG